MIEAFPTADAAADAAAEALAASLARPEPRRLVVTGGSTPGPVYDRLCQMDLGWSDVSLTLTDERFVAPDHADSNERLVRQRLLTNAAAAARFVPLKGAGATPGDDARAAEPAVRALAPFDAVLIGMGEDGHIASLFPGDPDLPATLDPDGPRWVVGVAEAGLAPYVPRISLTLRTLIDSRLILLLVKGAAKRALIERVLAEPSFASPVASLLRQTRAPVRVIWSE